MKKNTVNIIIERPDRSLSFFADADDVKKAKSLAKAAIPRALGANEPVTAYIVRVEEVIAFAPILALAPVEESPTTEPTPDNSAASSGE